MTKIFSGHQPNFLPYMGFFYKLYKSDVFVLDDDVQYSRTEMQNYNYIKVQNERHKLTIPVKHKFGQKINEVQIAYDRKWTTKMLKTVENSYRKARFFDEGYQLLEASLSKNYEFLVDLNMDLLKNCILKFDISTEILIASKDLPTPNLKSNERNVAQCTMVGADTYLSGIGGKAYNDEKLYKEADVNIVYTSYKPLTYKQVGKHIDNLSVLDYVMNVGFSIPEEWK